MQEVVPFCIEHDRARPDLKLECANQGTVRPYCVGPDAEPLNADEREAIVAERDRYYKKNWHRVMYRMLGYKSPSVANADLYSLASLETNKDEKIYFHVDFMKPGKNTYVVEHNDKE